MSFALSSSRPLTPHARPRISASPALSSLQGGAAHTQFSAQNIQLGWTRICFMVFPVITLFLCSDQQVPLCFFGNTSVLAGVNSTMPPTAFIISQALGLFVDIPCGPGARVIDDGICKVSTSSEESHSHLLVTGLLT